MPNGKSSIYFNPESRGTLRSSGGSLTLGVSPGDNRTTERIATIFTPSFHGDSEMTRNNQISLALSGAFFVIAIFILLFTRGLSIWLMLLIVVLMAINLSVESLTLWIPAGLRDLSNSNCLRLDGTRSSRRSSRERRAMTKIRTDLWATFLIVAFFGAISAFTLQSQFPLKLVPEVASSALDSLGSTRDFKVALKDRGVDQQFFDWSESETNRSNEGARERQERLWMTWPAILLLLVFVFSGCMALVRFAYIRTLQDFATGVQARSVEYLNLDIGRLQG
jgi:hypothetical protein